MHADDALSPWRFDPFRDDDIVISTYAKSGTTWMQQIIGQLVSGGADTSFAFMASPWLDLRVMPKDEVFAQLEAQQHRRFIKTHTPLPGLPLTPDVTYVCVGRDPRDVSLSMHDHRANPTALPATSGTGSGTG